MSDKALALLVNNIKMANILSPLLEAIEINKHTEGVKDLDINAMLKDVIKTGTEIYQRVIAKDNTAASVSLLGDQIFVLLSICLRNSTILYNSPSLDLIKDDLISLIEDNKSLLGQALEYNVENEDEPSYPPSTELGISSLAAMFTPVWLFHSNIFTSGLIDLDKLNELNTKVCFFLSQAINKIHNLSDNQLPAGIRSHLYYVCAEVASKVLVDYQIKLLKSKPVMMAYIDDPLPTMERILPVIHSAWGVLSETTIMSIKNLTGKA